jgi:hypothetical protein
VSYDAAAGISFRVKSAARLSHRPGTSCRFGRILCNETQETDMGFGRGALLWLLGIPLPIIILLALFWR